MAKCGSRSPRVVHELVKLLQRLGGRQLEHGQGVDRGAQPAHGDGGAHAVPGHVADHQGDPAAGQRDRLVPVAADLDELAAGQVAVLDLDRGRRGKPGRQHAPLQGQRGGVLPAVPAGVVDEHRGAGRRTPCRSRCRRRRTGGTPPAGCRRRSRAWCPARSAAAAAWRRPDSSLATGLRRQALAISLAGSCSTIVSSTGWPVSMHRVVRRVRRVAQDLAGRERRVPGRVFLVVRQRDPAQRRRSVRPVRRAARRRRPGSPAAAARPRCRTCGTSMSSSSRAICSMSSVSPILVERAVEHRVRMTAGSMNRSDLGAGMRSRASAARLVAGCAHRLDRHHRLGRVAVAGVDREHGAALTIGTDRLEQPGHRGSAVGLPGGGRIRLAAFGWALADVRSMSCAPSRSSGSRARILAAFLSCWTMRPS